MNVILLHGCPDKFLVSPATVIQLNQKLDAR